MATVSVSRPSRFELRDAGTGLLQGDAWRSLSPTAFDSQDAGTNEDAGWTRDFDARMGIWSGRVSDRTARGYTYTVCMTITQVSSLDAAAGTSEYSDGYDCSGPGDLTLVATSEAGVATFHEYFPNGGLCAAFREDGVDGRIEVAIQPDDTLGWTWFIAGTNSAFTAGTLARTSACP